MFNLKNYNYLPEPLSIIIEGRFQSIAELFPFKLIYILIQQQKKTFFLILDESLKAAFAIISKTFPMIVPSSVRGG